MIKRADHTTGAAGDAVRVLPPPTQADGRSHAAPAASQPQPRLPGALFVAFGVLGVVILAVALSIRADEPEATPLTTSTAPATLAPIPLEGRGTRTIDVTNPWGAAAGIGDGGIVTDIAAGSRLMAVAVGVHDSQAMVWSTANGDRWTPATSVEVPAGSETTLEAVVEWGEDWYALGRVDGTVAMWRADVWSEWEFTGTRGGLAEVEGITDLAASPDGLWLAGTVAGAPALWVSPGGEEWERRDPGFAPGEVVVTSIAAGRDGEWLYVGGSRCRGDTCRPALWRTRDGVVWQPAATVAGGDGGEIAAAAGSVASIAASADRIVAGGTSGGLPAVWISRDGENWSLVPQAMEFALPVSRVTLREISSGDSPIASLVVSERRVDAAPGDVLVTEVGEIRVAAVSRAGISFEFGDDTKELGVGSGTTLRLTRRVQHVAVQGGRILAVGVESMPTGVAPTPVAWISTDGGATWAVHRLGGGEETAGFAAIRSRRFAVITPAGLGWIYDWDPAVREAAAIDAVVRFVAAAVDGDLATVLGSLPAAKPTPGGRMALPGLSRVDLDWWDGATGLLDVAAIEGSLAFLEKLDTRVRFADCHGSALMGDTDEVRVECDVTVSSALIMALGLSEDATVLTAVVTGDDVASLNTPELTGLVFPMIRWARTEDPAAARLAFGDADETGSGTALPRPDADLAVAWLEWASRYGAALLVPGAEMETATPLGDVTWTFTDAFDGTWAAWLTSAQGVLWALVDADGSGPEPSQRQLWRSDDAISWEVVGELPGGEAWWEPFVFGDRLFVGDSLGDAPVLLEWGGSGWTEFEVDPYPEEGDWWLHSVAEADGRVLLMAEGWEPRRQRPLGSAIWALAEDGRFELLVPAGPDLSAEGDGDVPFRDQQTTLVGGVSDFLLVIQRYSPRVTELWSSPDGVTWELLTDEPFPDLGSDAWIENIEVSGNRLTASIWVGERCETSEGRTVCMPVWEDWESPDGAVWERGATRFSTISTRRARAPRGSVEVTWGEFEVMSPAGGESIPEPISVGLAAGNGPVVDIADLRILVPGADWQWVEAVEMTDAAVVIAIRSFREHPTSWGEEQYWVVVGRLPPQ